MKWFLHTYVVIINHLCQKFPELTYNKKEFSFYCNFIEKGLNQNHRISSKIFQSWSGVHFTNILRAAFTHSFYAQGTRADLKSAKKTGSLSAFLALLGSARVKAAHKALVKSTPGVDSINILHAIFLYKSALSSFSLVTFCLCDFFAKIYQQKKRVKCWWNWPQVFLTFRHHSIFLQLKRNQSLLLHHLQKIFD